MANRMITTELFDDSWFMDLPSKYKLFWVYLITKCNHSGIWQVNWKLAQFYTGDNLEPVEVVRVLKDRIVPIENNKYWFIPKFIEFQYGGKLNEESPVHKGIIANIRKYNLFDFCDKISIKERVSEGYQKGLETIKDIVIVKDIAKAKDKDISGNQELDENVKKLFIKRWSRNYKNFSELQGAEKLVLDYGIDKVNNAFRIAGESGKDSIPYVRGILLKEHKMDEPKQRYNSTIMNDMYSNGK